MKAMVVTDQALRAHASAHRCCGKSLPATLRGGAICVDVRRRTLLAALCQNWLSRQTRIVIPLVIDAECAAITYRDSAWDATKNSETPPRSPRASRRPAH
jgi:hypothetical protein